MRTPPRAGREAHDEQLLQELVAAFGKAPRGTRAASNRAAVQHVRLLILARGPEAAGSSFLLAGKSSDLTQVVHLIARVPGSLVGSEMSRTSTREFLAGGTPYTVRAAVAAERCRPSSGDLAIAVVEYLPPSIDSNRLTRAVERLVARVRPGNASVGGGGPARMLVLRTGYDAFHLLDFADVEAIVAEVEHLRIVAASNTWEARGALTGLARELASAGFARIRSSILLNLHAVINVEPLANGALAFETKGGARYVSTLAFGIGARDRMHIASGTQPNEVFRAALIEAAQ